MAIPTTFSKTLVIEWKMKYQTFAPSCHKGSRPTQISSSRNYHDAKPRSHFGTYPNSASNPTKHSSDQIDKHSDLSDFPLGTDTSIEMSPLSLPDLAPRRILHSDSDSTDSFYDPHNSSDDSLSDDSVDTTDNTSDPTGATHIIDPRPPSPTVQYSLFQQAQPTTTTLLPEQAQFFGDTIQLPKPNTIFRGATKNINHLSVNKIDDQITLMCVDQQRLEIDIQGIIKHKVDTGKYHVRQAFHAATRQVFDHAIVELGSSAYTSVTD
jgi:hypothetical protein